MKSFRGRFQWVYPVTFIVCFLVLLVGELRGENWSPSSGERYFGVLGDPIWECVFVLDPSEALPDGRYEGAVHYLESNIGGGITGPQAPRESSPRFSMWAVSEDSWRIAWTDSGSSERRSVDLEWIRTIRGACLAGRYDDRDQWGGKIQRLVLLWPDFSVQANPFQWPSQTTPDIIGVAKNRLAGDVLRSETARGGLASDATRCLFQSSDRYLWVGTVEGLSRYDGLIWTTFDAFSSPPLAASVIMSLAEDNEGRLLIGTKGDGIFRYDGSSFEPLVVNQLIGERSVSSVTSGPDGTIWFTVDGPSLGRLTPTGETEIWGVDEFNPYYHSITDYVKNSLMDVIPLESEVRISAKGNWLSFSDTPLEAAYGMVFGQYSGRMIPSAQGGFWWFHHGLVRLNAENEVVQRYDVPKGSYMAEAADGSLWWAMSYPPYDVFQHSEQGFFRYSVSEFTDSNAMGIIEDHQGNIWVATAANGVLRIRPQLVDTVADLPVPNGEVGAVAKVKGRPILCSRSGGIVEQVNDRWTAWNVNELPMVRQAYRSQSARLQPYRHDAVGGSVVGPSGLWVGLSVSDLATRLVDRGEISNSFPLLAFRGESETRLYFSEERGGGMSRVSSLGVSRQNGVFLAGREGIFQLRPGASSLVDWCRANGVDSFDGFCVLVDRQDRVWFGGDDSGLYRIDDDGVTHISRGGGGLVSNSVFSMCQSSDGALWVGAERGLTRIDEERQVTRFESGADFLERPIYSLVEDDQGYLWMGTPSGIFGVDRDHLDGLASREQNRLSAIRLGRRDGLDSESAEPQRTPGVIKTPDGRLWFCMDTSVAMFDPREVVRRHSVGPQVRISRFGNGQKVFYENRRGHGGRNADASVQLPLAARSTLKIEFEAISFSDPKWVSFEYRILEKSEHWFSSGSQRYVLYSGLPHGEYTFEVRALGGDNRLSENTAVMRIFLPKHYYETWFFRVSCLGCVLAVSWGLHSRRTSYLRQIEMLKGQVALDRERMRIARDMHDEFGTTLSRLVLRGGALIEGAEAGSTQKKVGERMRDSAVETMRSLREVIWSLNTEKSSFEDVAEYLHRLVESYFDGVEIQHRVVVNPNAETHSFSPALKRDLVLILKGILSNALTHSKASKFDLMLAMEAEDLVVSARDNGCGFDPDSIGPDSYGIQALKDRVQSWGGRLEILSRDGEGTTIEVRLCVPSGNGGEGSL